MTEPMATSATAVVKTWQMYRAMVGLGVLCGSLIVTSFLVTRATIAENRRRALDLAVRTVIPGADRIQVFVASSDGGIARGTEDNPGEERVYAAYAADGELLGVAIQGRGLGYQDLISVLYSYDRERQAVTGFAVLDSRETPGLGDRIATDPSFQENFIALDVTLDESGSELLHPIVAVRSGEKQSAWEIDGITGATISSVAVASILRESAARWIPKLNDHWESMRQGG